MSQIFDLFRATSAAEVLIGHSALPARAELIDISLVPFAQIDVLGTDELGIVNFANERALGGTLWKQAPFTIRVTPNGEPSYLVDFPWSPGTVRDAI